MAGSRLGFLLSNWQHAQTAALRDAGAGVHEGWAGDAQGTGKLILGAHHRQGIGERQHARAAAHQFTGSSGKGQSGHRPCT